MSKPHAHLQTINITSATKPEGGVALTKYPPIASTDRRTDEHIFIVSIDICRETIELRGIRLSLAMLIERMVFFVDTHLGLKINPYAKFRQNSSTCYSIYAITVKTQNGRWQPCLSMD